MAPKRNREDLTVAEQAQADGAALLRKRATPSLLHSHLRYSACTLPIPPSLRNCDGCDIVKKNSSKKSQKYLFVFPGAIDFPPGGKIGTLTGLDTTTPCLYVEFPQGRVRLKGTLVYPKNAFLGLKGAGKKKPVRCKDVFETLVVFSEWDWVGREGETAMGVPEEMKGEPRGLWSVGEEQGSVKGEESTLEEERVEKRGGKGKKLRRVILGDESDESDEIYDHDGESGIHVISIDSSVEYTPGKHARLPSEGEGVICSEPRRSSRRRRTSYKDLFKVEDEDEEEDDGDGEEQEEYDDDDYGNNGDYNYWKDDGEGEEIKRDGKSLTADRRKEHAQNRINTTRWRGQVGKHNGLVGRKAQSEGESDRQGKESEESRIEDEKDESDVLSVDSMEYTPENHAGLSGERVEAARVHLRRSARNAGRRTSYKDLLEDDDGDSDNAKDDGEDEEIERKEKDRTADGKKEPVYTRAGREDVLQ